MDINFYLGELVDKLGTPVGIALILIVVGLVLLILLWKDTNPERTQKFAFLGIYAVLCIFAGFSVLIHHRSHVLPKWQVA